MLKFLLAAAPYLLKTPDRTSQKQIARSFTALVLFALSGMAFSAAVFIYVTSLYGAALGFVSVSVLFLIVGVAMFLKAKRSNDFDTADVSSLESTDPIAALIPEAVREDPTVRKIMKQVSANPVAASVAAATIGMLITREFMKD